MSSLSRSKSLFPRSSNVDQTGIIQNANKKLTETFNENMISMDNSEMEIVNGGRAIYGSPISPIFVREPIGVVYGSPINSSTKGLA